MKFTQGHSFRTRAFDPFLFFFRSRRGYTAVTAFKIEEDLSHEPSREYR